MSTTSSTPFNSIVKQAFTTVPILPLEKLKPGKVEFPKSVQLVTGRVLQPGLLILSQLFHLYWPGTFHLKKRQKIVFSNLGESKDSIGNYTSASFILISFSYF